MTKIFKSGTYSKNKQKFTNYDFEVCIVECKEIPFFYPNFDSIFDQDDKAIVFSDPKKKLVRKFSWISKFNKQLIKKRFFWI